MPARGRIGGCAHSTAMGPGRNSLRMAVPTRTALPPASPGAADGRAIPDARQGSLGGTMARWSARALLIAAGVFLVGGLTWYARGATVPLIVAALVAFIDSVVITLGMLVIGTPHVLPLAMLSVVSLFIPILGAWVSGTVIVLVTLASQGAAPAAAIAVVILVAQQLDSMFVTPLVYQQTVNLHPIVTLSAVIVGSQLLGIVGAFLAVPLVAVFWAVFKVIEAQQKAATTPASPAPSGDP